MVHALVLCEMVRVHKSTPLLEVIWNGGNGMECGATTARRMRWPCLASLSHVFCQPFSWRLAAPFSCAYVHQGEPLQTRQLNNWTPRAREIIFKEELQKHGDQQNASLADQEGVGWSKDLCDLANLSCETTTGEAAKVHLLQHCWSSQRGPFKCRNRKSFKFTETDTVIIEVSRYLRHFEAIDRVQCSIGLPALIPPPSIGEFPPCQLPTWESLRSERPTHLLIPGTGDHLLAWEPWQNHEVISWRSKNINRNGNWTSSKHDCVWMLLDMLHILYSRYSLLWNYKEELLTFPSPIF